MDSWLNLSREDAQLFMGDYRNRVTGVPVTAKNRQPVRAEMAAATRGGTVLDVGCAKGAEIRQLFDPALYLGVDISPQLIDLARELNPGFRFLQADATRLPFADDSFDFAISKSVLEHVPSEEVAVAIFRELARVGRRAIVVWHTPPIYDETEIIVLHGYIPSPLYQNHYARRAFAFDDLRIDRRRIDDAFELWTVERL